MRIILKHPKRLIVLRRVIRIVLITYIACICMVFYMIVYDLLSLYLPKGLFDQRISIRAFYNMTCHIVSYCVYSYYDVSIL